jgi:hypothetical protein
MFGHQTRILVGLLLILLVFGCTSITGNDDIVQPDENLGITDDGSTVPYNQDITEPPSATLTIASLKQNAGMTAYCWQRGDGTSLCGDGFGVTTPIEPVPAGSTFTAEFEFLIDVPPESVGLSVFPAYQPVENAPESSDWRYWKAVPGEIFTLPSSQNPSIELTLEPGLYAFGLFADWLEYGNVSYGFLVDVEGAIRMEEEMQQIQYQETISEIQPLLMSELADIYGGLWVEQDPAYRIVIALTEGNLDTIQSYVASYDWADFVEVEPVTHTLEELKADEVIASQAANTIHASAITTVDIINNRVEFIVDKPSLVYIDLIEAGIDLPESVVVLSSDPEGILAETIRGVILEAIAPSDRPIYLPVQPPGEARQITHLEGVLAEVNGCLRIEDPHTSESWLVLWPYRHDIRVTDDRIEIINLSGQPVAQVGDPLRTVGVAVEDSRAMASFDEMVPGMPINGCPGPYWVVASWEIMSE